MMIQDLLSLGFPGMFLGIPGFFLKFQDIF